MLIVLKIDLLILHIRSLSWNSEGNVCVQVRQLSEPVSKVREKETSREGTLFRVGDVYRMWWIFNPRIRGYEDKRKAITRIRNGCNPPSTNPCCAPTLAIYTLTQSPTSYFNPMTQMRKRRERITTRLLYYMCGASFACSFTHLKYSKRDKSDVFYSDALICQLQTPFLDLVVSGCNPRLEDMIMQNLSPEFAIRIADVRRISVTSRMGLVNFGNHN